MAEMPVGEPCGDCEVVWEGLRPDGLRDEEVLAIGGAAPWFPYFEQNADRGGVGAGVGVHRLDRTRPRGGQLLRGPAVSGAGNVIWRQWGKRHGATPGPRRP